MDFVPVGEFGEMGGGPSVISTSAEEGAGGMMISQESSPDATMMMNGTTPTTNSPFFQGNVEDQQYLNQNNNQFGDPNNQYQQANMYDSNPMSPQQQQQLQLSQDIGEDYTRVNGIGIWESWRKNFKSPLFALLDLFDNAIDACFDIKQLGDDRVGEISVTLEGGKNSKQKKNSDANFMPYDNSSSSEGGNEMILRNNCSQPISPIRQILELYKSNKDTTTIGQNGIGTKQACANLCDLSFILTKNGDEVSMGVIAKFLQTQKGPYLPSMTFLTDDPNSDEPTPSIKQQLHIMDWGRIFTEYGKGIHKRNQQQHDMDEENHIDLVDDQELKQLGLERIHEHIQSLLSDPNEYVFMCILTQIRHNHREELMNELKVALPIYYVHVPTSFHVTVDNERVDFQYWEKRLVELTAFHVKIHPKKLWYLTSDWAQETGVEDDAQIVGGDNSVVTIPNNTFNKLRIFIGFDPYVNQSGDGKNKEAALYIYSRRSGRLVKQVKNARGYLHLGTGSTNFCQGLTILVDDYSGCLPLTPTKQDLAFSLEASGEVHETNFETWVSAFVHMYYTYHLYNFGERKEALSNAIDSASAELKSQVRKLTKRKKQSSSDDENEVVVAAPSLASLNDGKFTTIRNITWRNYSDERLRVYLKKKLTRQKEKDTLCHLKHIDQKKLLTEKEQQKEEKKRKTKEEYFQMYQDEQEQEQEDQLAAGPVSNTSNTAIVTSSSNKRRRTRMVSHKSVGGGPSPYQLQQNNNRQDEDDDGGDFGDDNEQDNGSNTDLNYNTRKRGRQDDATAEPALSQASMMSQRSNENDEDVAALTEKLTKYKHKHKEMKSLTQELLEDNQKVHGIKKLLEERVQELELELEKKNGQRAVVKSEFNEDNEALKETIETLESKTMAQEKEIEQLKAEKIELEKSTKNLEKEKDLMERLEQDSQKEVDLLRSSNDTLKEQVKYLQGKLKKRT